VTTDNDSSIPKYGRVGHIYLERPCDFMVDRALKLLPGTGTMPSRWAYKDREYFQKTYGKTLGSVIWAKNASNHLLLIKGRYVIRIWTDALSTTLCDIAREMVSDLEDRFDIIDIPKSSYKKTFPLIHRVKLVTIKDVDAVMLSAVKQFALDSILD
jgi:hypothetical protein